MTDDERETAKAKAMEATGSMVRNLFAPPLPNPEHDAVALRSGIVHMLAQMQAAQGIGAQDIPKMLRNAKLIADFIETGKITGPVPVE